MMTRALARIVAVLAVGTLFVLPALAEDKKVLRAGMIGLDTSHVTAFANLINVANPRPPFNQVRIVAAYPGGSKDLDVSSKRIDGFTKTLKEKHGVEIVESIEALLPKVDVVFLESVDGRPHLEQAIPVLKARKPLFIDKPMAISLADVLRIFDLGKETGTPVFSSSSLRFYTSTREAKKAAQETAPEKVISTGPMSLLPFHPDMFWYGIHGIESLYAVMGPGCVEVTRETTKDFDTVTGKWKDGRVGIFKGALGKGGYGIELIGPNGSKSFPGKGGYEELVSQIITFFQTGKSPIPNEETIELFAFMEAADESKKQGGKPVSIESILARARAEVAKDKK
jgi:predicted dehydrogenase